MCFQQIQQEYQELLDQLNNELSVQKQLDHDYEQLINQYNQNQKLIDFVQEQIDNYECFECLNSIISQIEIDYDDQQSLQQSLQQSNQLTNYSQQSFQLTEQTCVSNLSQLSIQKTCECCQQPLKLLCNCIKYQFVQHEIQKLDHVPKQSKYSLEQLKNKNIVDYFVAYNDVCFIYEDMSYQQFKIADYNNYFHLNANQQKNPALFGQICDMEQTLPVYRNDINYGQSVQQKPYEYYGSQSLTNIAYKNRFRQQVSKFYNNKIVPKINEIRYIYYDIETVNVDINDKSIPSFNNKNSFITTIQMLICYQNTQQKVIFINNQFKLNYDKQYFADNNVQITLFDSEIQMCREFIYELCKEIQTICIGYNASIDIYSTNKQYNSSIGYDLQFICARSYLKLDFLKNSVQIKYLNKNAACIEKIKQLSYVYFIDAMFITCLYLTQEGIQAQNLKLQTICELFNIDQKIDLDHSEIQYMICNPEQNKYDFTEFLKYGIRDVEILNQLIDKTEILQLKLQSYQNGVPLYISLFKTQRQIVEYIINDKFLSQGYQLLEKFGDYAISNDFQNKGAYTFVKEGQYWSNILIQPDVQSMYPSLLIYGHISHENFSFDKNDDSYKEFKVDDYENGNVYKFYYKQQNGVLDTMVYDLLQQRLVAKKLMSDYKKNGQMDLCQQQNVIQKYLKLQINIIYGLLGSKYSSLYMPTNALLITYLGRELIKYIQNQCLYYQPKSQVIQIDTDSVSLDISETGIKNHKECLQLINNINNDLNIQYKSDYPNLIKIEIEEVFLSFYSIAKKSYLSKYLPLYELDKIQDIDFTNEQCYRQLLQHEKIQNKHKGVQLKLYNKQGQKILLQLIDEFMYQKPNDVFQWIMNKKNELQQQIQTLINDRDYDQLSNYLNVVKYSTKNQLINRLIDLYPQLKDKLYFIIVPIINVAKYSKKSLYYTELSLIDNINKTHIDIQQITLSFISKFNKIIKNQIQLVNGQWKKLTSYQLQYCDLINEYEMDSDQFVVREEKLKNGRVSYSQKILTFDEYKKICNEQRYYSEPYYSYHEIITKNQIRLVLDCDELQYLPDCFEYTLHQIIQQLLIGQQQIYIEILSNENKYHIYTNIQCSLMMARYIANQLNMYYQEKLSTNKQICDTKIYRIDGSLRLYNSIKIVKNNQNKYECSNNRYKLVDYSEQYFYHITNLQNTICIRDKPHLFETYCFDNQYIQKTQKSFDNDKIQLLTNKLNELKIKGLICQSNDFVQIRNIEHKNICCICQRQHQRIDMYAYISNNNIYLNCYGNNDKKYQAIIIHCQQDQDQDQQQQLSIIDQMDNYNKNYKYEALQNSLQLNQQYLGNIDEYLNSFQNIYIKSHMGTGKTESIIRYLQNLQNKVNQKTLKVERIQILYVTHRITFSQSLKTRLLQKLANRYSIRCYNDSDEIKQKYRSDDDFIYICQLESIQYYNYDIIIVDELESILTQQSGYISYNNQSIVKLFRQCANINTKCIFMDGYLQEQSIKYINTCVSSYTDKEIQSIIIENSYQPYQNEQIKLYVTNKIKDVKIDMYQKILTKDSFGFKKSCVFSTSYKDVEHLQQYLIDYNRCRSKQIDQQIKYICLHGQNGQFIIDNGQIKTHYDYKQDVIPKLNELLYDTDVFIYTSTITAGIDIQWNFDQQFCLLKKNTCDPFQFIQGIFRLRNVDQRYIYLKNQCNYEHLQSLQQYIREYQYDNLSENDQCQQFIKLRKNNMFALQNNIIVNQLRQLGYKINLDPYNYEVINNMGVDISLKDYDIDSLKKTLQDSILFDGNDFQVNQKYMQIVQQIKSTINNNQLKNELYKQFVKQLWDDKDTTFCTILQYNVKHTYTMYQLILQCDKQYNINSTYTQQDLQEMCAYQQYYKIYNHHCNVAKQITNDSKILLRHGIKNNKSFDPKELQEHKRYQALSKYLLEFIEIFKDQLNEQQECLKTEFNDQFQQYLKQRGQKCNINELQKIFNCCAKYFTLKKKKINGKVLNIMSMHNLKMFNY